MLARVHVVDGSSSGDSPRSFPERTVASQFEDLSLEDPELSGPETFLHTEDYVEARGILLPATEYLKRAVEESLNAQQISGDLLILVSFRFSAA